MIFKPFLFLIASLFSDNLEGTYTGSKTELGETIQGTVIFSDSSNTLIFDTTGVVNIHCENEEYELDNDKIIMKNINNDGDCAHDALKENNVSLKSISYDKTNDIINIDIKYSIISLDIELTKEKNYLRGSIS